MNYITHLNKAFAIFCGDERLTPFHISLYFGLFQYWNMAKFRNPISISRDELMRASKIGSVNTYIRCIKELDKWQYIKYIPSYNPQKGSQVYLYNFNNSNNNGSDISNDKGTDKAAEKGTGNAGETQVIPFINNTNIVNNINSLNGSKPTQKIIVIKTLSSHGSSKKEKEKSFAKKVREKDMPTLESVGKYFSENEYPAVEGKKFYNHYESNGWLVGGKTPMKNWQAAANKWILTSEEYNHGKASSTNHKTGSRAGHLHTTGNKDYGEAL